MPTHKAIICETVGSIKNIMLKTVPSLDLMQGFARVKVKAAGVNYPDKLMLEGKYQYKPQVPFTPGLEVSGLISDINGGSDFKIGDRVSCIMRSGGYSEEVVVPIESLNAISDGFSYEEGATFRVASQTAYVALIDQAKLKKGESLLVLGASGGVGSAAIKIGSAVGAQVIAVASSEAKRKHCRLIGANQDISYDNLSNEVLQLTAKKGVDVVFDPVGGKIFRESLRCLRWGGKYLVVGFADGEIPVLPINLVLIKGISLMGIRAGEYYRRFADREKKGLVKLNQMAEKGLLKPDIYKSFKLKHAESALNLLKKREAIGRMVLIP